MSFTLFCCEYQKYINSLASYCMFLIPRICMFANNDNISTLPDNIASVGLFSNYFNRSMFIQQIYFRNGRIGSCSKQLPQVFEITLFLL